MTKFLLGLVTAAVLGTATGWTINYAKYGRIVGNFGPFTTENGFRAEDLKSTIPVDKGDSAAKVKMLTPPSYDFGMMKPDRKSVV